MQNLSERIKWIRKNKGLTQTEFGERLGVSRSVVNNWERDAVVPPNPTFTAISAIFGVNENWLQTGIGDDPYEKSNLVDEIIKRHGLSTSARIILETLIELPEAYQTALLEFAKALTSKANEIDYQNTVNEAIHDYRKAQAEQNESDVQEDPAVQ